MDMINASVASKRGQKHMILKFKQLFFEVYRQQWNKPSETELKSLYYSYNHGVFLLQICKLLSTLFFWNSDFCQLNLELLAVAKINKKAVA